MSSGDKEMLAMLCCQIYLIWFDLKSGHHCCRHDDDDDDGYLCILCRSVKFECKRPCCVELAGKSSSSTHITTTTTTTAAAAAAAAAGGGGSTTGGDGYSSSIKHHRAVACHQPVGPVRCRSSPGISLSLLLWPLTSMMVWLCWWYYLIEFCWVLSFCYFACRCIAELKQFLALLSRRRQSLNVDLMTCVDLSSSSEQWELVWHKYTTNISSHAGLA